MEIAYNSSNPYNFSYTLHKVIDTVNLFFHITPNEPFEVHLSPISRSNSDIIVSSVSSDSRREYSETLWFQGLSSLVWILVGFSLLIVSGLTTYLSFKNEKKNRPKTSLNSWMNNVSIFAADIVNNCFAGIVEPGPGRHLRSWWLLGVVFLMQFWVAGMKSDLLIDKSSFVDSVEDLFSKPELLCVMSNNVDDNPFCLTEDDHRYKDYQKMKKRIVEDKYDEISEDILINGSGVIIGQETSALLYIKSMFEKLKEANRKKYIGKQRYGKRYSYTIFNKRLPRAIKENVDYLISRLFETRQTEPILRKDKYRSRNFIFDPTENSEATISWSAYSVAFLSPVFRVWTIGMSLSTFVFCIEFYRSRASRRRSVNVSLHHSIGIQIRA